MADLIEWRTPTPGVGLREIVLNFDGREYLIGRAMKVDYGSEHTFWQFTWPHDIFLLMDGAIFNIPMDEPLEPLQKRVEDWVVLNLWKIVRELRKRDE